MFEPLTEECEVGAALGNKAVGAIQLRNTDGSLKVSNLQVVSNVRVNVLVIVAMRQLAQLPVETLSTGVHWRGGSLHLFLRSSS